MRPLSKRTVAAMEALADALRGDERPLYANELGEMIGEPYSRTYQALLRLERLGEVERVRGGDRARTVDFDGTRHVLYPPSTAVLWRGCRVKADQVAALEALFEAPAADRSSS